MEAVTKDFFLGFGFVSFIVFIIVILGYVIQAIVEVCHDALIEEIDKRIFSFHRRIAFEDTMKNIKAREQKKHANKKRGRPRKQATHQM